MLTYILSKTFTNVDVMGFKIGWINWEQQKLKTVVNRVTRKNVNNESNLPLTISAQDGLIAQDHFFDKKVASQNLQNYLLLKKGDFAYNKSYSNGYPFGSIKRLNKYKEGVISSLYIAFKPKQADSDYLEQFFDSDKWHREIYSRAAEGARNHGLLNISPNDFFDADVKLPSSNEEQKMIGDILKKVSEIITLQQHKLDQLNTLKKGLLQKMFADKKHPKPELRFKSFHDNWINHKAGDFMIERNQKATIDDDFPLKAFIANKGVADKGERYDRSAITNDASNKMYKRTLFNDFIYSSNNLETGSIGLNKYGNASISPVYSIFYFKNKESADFFGRILVRKEFINSMIRYRQGVVYGQWRIKEKDFLNISISVPSLEEQEKIGSLLDKLDETINVNSKLLNQLKVLKKSLLQNMFI